MNNLFLSTQIQDIRPVNEMTIPQLAEKYGLNWKVEKLPLVATMPHKSITTDFFGMTRMDTGNVFATSKKGYQIFQNSLFLELVQKFAMETGAEIEQVNVLKGGARIYCVLGVAVNPFGTVNENDKVGIKLIVSNSHDGSSALRVCLAHNFFICNNGMVRIDAKGSFSIRHTASMESKLRSLINGERNLIKESQNMFDAYGRMNETKVLPQHVDHVLELVTGLDLKSDISTRGENILASLGESIKQEMSYRNNALGLYNGVTHFSTHKAEKSENALNAKFSGVTAKRDFETFQFCESISLN